jgi:glycosyltransferase involved in cell wall biosynthesis
MTEYSAYQRMRKKVGYVLYTNPKVNNPSTRISVMNMHPFLQSYGYDPIILYRPEDHYSPKDSGCALRSITASAIHNGVEIVYFHRMRGSEVITVINELKRLGIKSIHGVCDFVDNEMVQACDATISVSDYHRGLHSTSLQHKIHVVHDGIEVPDVHKKKYSDYYATPEKPMEMVLLTGLCLNAIPFLRKIPAFIHLTVIGKYNSDEDSSGQASFTMASGIRRLWREPGINGIRSGLANLRRMYFEGLQQRRIQFDKKLWDYATVWTELLNFDLAIIPWDLRRFGVRFPHTDLIKSKSANRLTQLMAIGLPVIASPVPSYLPIIRQGENGFIARSRVEWKEFFEVLRDPQKRECIGRYARASVLEQYSAQKQAEKLVSIFDSLTSDKD